MGFPFVEACPGVSRVLLRGGAFALVIQSGEVVLAASIEQLIDDGVAANQRIITEYLREIEVRAAVVAGSNGKRIDACQQVARLIVFLVIGRVQEEVRVENLDRLWSISEYVMYDPLNSKESRT